MKIPKTIVFKKGAVLQHQGDVNTKVFHVKKGLLRSYSIDEKGKEHIFMFAPEGWIMADSQPPELPSDLFIDAIEDTTVIVLEKDSKNEVTQVEALLKRIRVLQKRVMMLMSASATERYQYFIQTYPDIIRRVPQKMIASFLGITPEALSTIKRKMKRQ